MTTCMMERNECEGRLGDNFMALTSVTKNNTKDLVCEWHTLVEGVLVKTS